MTTPTCKSRFIYHLSDYWSRNRRLPTHIRNNQIRVDLRLVLLANANYVYNNLWTMILGNRTLLTGSAGSG